MALTCSLCHRVWQKVVAPRQGSQVIVHFAHVCKLGFIYNVRISYVFMLLLL